MRDPLPPTHTSGSGGQHTSGSGGQHTSGSGGREDDRDDRGGPADPAVPEVGGPSAVGRAGGAAGRAGGVWERLRPDRRAAWIAAFVLIGLAARCVRYGLKFPLWEDECFLCVNFLGPGSLGTARFEHLAGPLQYRQVAPPLFLFAELGMVKLLGFHEWALRLIPFLCSAAGLLLFARLARTLLPGRAATLAVAIFAVAYPGVRYAAEAKPYASDALVAVVLLSLAVHWRRTGRARWLWVAAAFAPLAVGVSYPATFVCGGVSLAVLIELRRRRRAGRNVPAAWAWAAFNLATAGAFGALLLTAAKEQAGRDLDFMRIYWGHTFPPLAEPWNLPGWLLSAHTSDLLAWPVGGGRGASTLTAVLVAAGLPWAFRGGRRGLSAFDRPVTPRPAAGGTGWFLPALLLGPFAVHLLAAALHRYPYGGHVKFSMHLGPAICLLAGAGGAWWAARVARLHRPRPRWEPRTATALLLALAGVGLVSMARDVANGAKNPADARQRAFARWFFHDAALEGPVELVVGDAAGPFAPQTWTELRWSAMFLCNRAIQTPDAPPRAGPFTPPPGRFRCVIYRDGVSPFDFAARDRWLADLRTKHRLVGRDRFPLTRSTRRGRWVATDWVESYRFAPLAPAPRPPPPPPTLPPTTTPRGPAPAPRRSARSPRRRSHRRRGDGGPAHRQPEAQA